MTRCEAEERAAKIWGDQVRGLLLWDANAAPSRAQWNVELWNGSYHDLDPNGHATCHQECADTEVQVCT